MLFQSHFTDATRVLCQDLHIDQHGVGLEACWVVVWRHLHGHLGLETSLNINLQTLLQGQLTVQQALTNLSGGRSLLRLTGYWGSIVFRF